MFGRAVSAYKLEQPALFTAGDLKTGHYEKDTTVREVSRTTFSLSLVIAVLAALASAAGLFVDGLYRDNTWVSSQLRGNDLVTLVAAVPLLIVGLRLGSRGALRWRLIWLGMLGYMLYGYTFYLFGAALNVCFLLYVALCSLSIFTLILALRELDVTELARHFSAALPVRWVSAYMLLVAGFLGLLWLSQVVSFMLTGVVPADVTRSGSPIAVVYAVDLTLMVPAMLLGAYLLWKRQPWGYILASILTIKGVAYPLALLGMSLFAAQAGVADAWALAPLWAFLGALGLLAAWRTLSNVQPQAAAPLGRKAARRARVAQ